MKRKSYRTARLELRPFTLRDFNAWVAAHEAAKPPLDKFDISPWPINRRTKAEFKALVKRQLKKANLDKVYVWNIFVRKTGEFVGRIDIATIAREPHQMANLGYYVINTYRGHGYA